MYNITPHGRVKISKDTVKVGNLNCFIYVNKCLVLFIVKWLHVCY